MDKKRERGKNYTDKEKEDLINIVSKYVNIVENKRTDIRTIKEKNVAWEKIVKEFCVLSQTGERSVAQLKMLYEGLKKKAKRDKRNILIKNSDDVKNNIKLNNISLKILSLLENKMYEQKNGMESENSLKNERADVSNENLQSSDFDIHVIKAEVDDETPPRAEAVYENFLANQDILSKLNKRKFAEEYYYEKRKLKLELLQIKKEKQQCIRDIKFLEKREKEIDLLMKEECFSQLKNNSSNN